jgi:ATP-binding cassette subfamily B protein
MADYFETDCVTKEYDSRLVRRILSYLKPYRLLMFFTFAALAVSTLGELFVPVLQQRIIDEAILARFYALNSSLYTQERGNLSADAVAAYGELASEGRAIRIGDMVFVPRGRRMTISGNAEAELRGKGLLDESQWYAFSFSADEAVFSLLEKYPQYFLSQNLAERQGEGPASGSAEFSAAIRTEDMRLLSTGEISLLRRKDISFILKGGIVFLALLLLIFLFTFSQTWTAYQMSQRVMKDIRLELFRKTASQSTAFLSRHPVGRIVTRLTGDVETINEFFTTVLVAFMKDLSVMAGALITLFILSPKMALAVLVTVPPVIAITLYSRLKARDAFRQQRTASSKVYAYLAERIAGIQVMQLFRGEKKSQREFTGRNRELLDANLGEMYVFAVFRPIVEWLSVLTTAIVIVVGSKMILSLSVSLGVLIAFINLVQMFYAPVTDIAEKYTLLQSAMAGGERVFKLLDTDERIPDAGKAFSGQTVRGHIEFKDVRFSYNKGEEVLKGLSFNIHPGESAAIVGHTGAGKTTITNVLARLWDIDSGEITLDGVALKAIPLDELRRAVLPVLQDVFLFAGTVEENISLGLELSQEEVVAAAQAVHAHEFISRLPDGYKTMLSEGAANISLGQRQLISFARVIAHNPRVVILDEATSSVDTETEHLIQMGIQRVLAGRTSIIIAHRLSTIRNADQILALSAGRVVEEGRHEELIASNGLYAGLYKLQYAEGKGEVVSN